MDFETYANYKSMCGEMYPELDQFIRDSVANYQTSRSEELVFLDYGSGDGKFYDYYLKLGLKPENLVGLEISQTRVDNCREKGWEKVYKIDPLQKFPLEDNSVDIILFNEVIEHINKNEIDFYLEEMQRVLRPNGICLCTTPNYPIKRIYDFIDVVFSKKFDRIYDDPTHVNKFSLTKFQKTLSRYFGEVKVEALKTGVFYRKFHKMPFAHKLMGICKNS